VEIQRCYNQLVTVDGMPSFRLGLTERGARDQEFAAYGFCKTPDSLFWFSAHGSNWPIATDPACLLQVGYQGQSEKYLLTLSLGAVDPNRSLAVVALGCK
jgi:hypothetical protein